MKRTGVGLAILIVAVLIAYYSHQRVLDYDRGTGWVKKTFSTEHADREASFRTLRLAGLLGIAVGAGVTASGLVRRRR